LAVVLITAPSIHLQDGKSGTMVAVYSHLFQGELYLLLCIMHSLPSVMLIRSDASAINCCLN
ncbi:MAG TPA: hypothetical protein PLS83_04725, partial [Methanothrix soehngenii]|nr:hypothetical protein [Methanothrix soehngenii]